jgi:hypothetical protein
MYTAQGRSGQSVYRAFPTEMRYAVDVADKDGRTERARTGQIWKFFTSEDRAQKWAEKMQRGARVTEPHAFNGRDRLRMTLSCGDVIARPVK